MLFVWLSTSLIIYNSLEIFLDVSQQEPSSLQTFKSLILECNGRGKKYGFLKKEIPKNSIFERISEYKVHRNRRSDKIGELQNSIAEDWKIASFKLHNTRARSRARAHAISLYEFFYFSLAFYRTRFCSTPDMRYVYFPLMLKQNHSLSSAFVKVFAVRSHMPRHYHASCAFCDIIKSCEFL